MNDPSLPPTAQPVPPTAQPSSFAVPATEDKPLNRTAAIVFDTKPVAVELEAGDHWWCACGLSAHQPMCDGNHKGSGFGPKKFTLVERKKVWLCNCKQTKNPPFCDGSHKALAPT